MNTELRHDVPTVQELLLPILQSLEKAGTDGSMKVPDIVDSVIHRLKLSEKALSITNKSGRLPKIYELVTLTLTHLRYAILVKKAEVHGMNRITARGVELLNSEPPLTTLSYAKLREYDEYRDVTRQKYLRRRKKVTKRESDTEPIPDTPAPSRSTLNLKTLFPTAQQLERVIHENLEALQKGHEDTLSKIVRNLNGNQVGHLLMALLFKMGFGDPNVKENTIPPLTSGATINDPMGLNQVYARITTEEKTGIEALAQFTAAFNATQAERGIFVSIGGFTPEAHGYVLGSAKRIKLMDEAEFVRLLAAYGVGLTIHARYTIKRIDPRYFEWLAQSAP